MNPEVITKEIKNKVKVFLSQKFNTGHGLSEVKTKDDNTLVTEVDFFISNLVENIFKNNKDYASYTFYSEEKNNIFSYPCIILDPIDGTKEMVNGVNECAISLSVLEGPSMIEGVVEKKPMHLNWSWIYNPFTGFERGSFNNNFTLRVESEKKELFGLVSRTEWAKGTYGNMENIHPRGSIAFKLGLLASGACDFVISTTPKNIWDIAAGTHLCVQQGIYLHSSSGVIESLDKALYKPPLLWCSSKNLPSLTKKFMKKI